MKAEVKDRLRQLGFSEDLIDDADNYDKVVNKEKIRAKNGPWLLVQKQDGMIYWRRPGRPDERMPYSVEYAEICVDSFVNKHGWELVVE